MLLLQEDAMFNQSFSWFSHF